MINIYCKVCRDCFMCANYIEIACLAGQWVRKRAYMCTVHKLFVCLLVKFVRIELVKKRFTCGERPLHVFRLLARLGERARVWVSHSLTMLISVRRLLISCLISTTLVRISTKRFPVRLTLCHFWYREVHSGVGVEAVRILCVPVQECNDVEDELGLSVGACWWVGSNHENRIGLKRGSPLSGGDLFVHKSKPIAKSVSQSYVTK